MPPIAPRHTPRNVKVFFAFFLLLTSFSLAEEDIRALLSSDIATRTQASKRIIQSRNKQWIPSLAEICFYYTIQRNASGVEEISKILRKLTGFEKGKKYFDWVQWIGKHPEIKPLPDYIKLKSEILSTIDPAFAVFFENEKSFRIRPEEIIWGGVKKDGIPALRNPSRIPAIQASYLKETDRVLGIFLGGEARAYPLRIMDWHEMVNDMVGGIPITIAYCTLCGSAILYSGKIGDQIYTFGSSGLLYRSNKLMYDDQTLSLWSALSGEPVAGKLIDHEIKLTILPVVVTTWAEWKRQHPQTTVLSKETGYDRDYDVEPYKEYFASDKNIFPVPLQNDILHIKDRIFALRLGKIKKAYPLEVITGKQMLKDKVDGVAVVLVSDESGTGVRAYRCDGLNPDRSWNATEEALTSPDGKYLCKRLPGHLAYWFGWYAQFPDTQLYR